jgi:CHAT domain-containing protein/Tfp pilus assembly protein PilF
MRGNQLRAAITSAGRWRLAAGLLALLGNLLGLVTPGLAVSAVAQKTDWQAQFNSGVNARERGSIELSLRELEQAARSAPDNSLRTQALTQLGVSLIAADRLSDAKQTLESALNNAAAGARVPISLALGNIAVRQHDLAGAADLYHRVLADAENEPDTRSASIAARLNLARIGRANERFAQLARIYPDVAAIPDTTARARAYLNLGNQLSTDLPLQLQVEAPNQQPGQNLSELPRTGRAAQMLELAYRSLSESQALSQQGSDQRLQLESADALAQLYEAGGRLDDALELDRAAIKQAKTLPPAQTADLLLRLEWRSGRLQKAVGNRSAATASYLRTAGYLVAIREDLPIEDDEGRSTYRSLVRPIFADLSDLLLTGVDTAAPAERKQRLSAVADVLEVTRQAELQDFLGDRCSVAQGREVRALDLESSVAILYVAVLRDRVEMILRSGGEYEHYTVRIAQAELDREVLAFRGDLLKSSNDAYRTEAVRLYQMLIQPLASTLVRNRIRNLVVVPDGSLRLIPFAAFYDGEHFLAEQYAVSSVVGLTLTNLDRHYEAGASSLLVGLSEPGPVVNKLAAMGFGATPYTRGGGTDPQALKTSLSLPGVGTEIRSIAATSGSSTLLDKDFTLGKVRQELGTGRFNRLHIASHAFLGDSARDSFLLAFDDVIRLDDLQALISTRSHPSDIDLLTLSACDTAEGDERAPLGFAGAAIKAQARTVVGSLWVVNDVATTQFMQSFYRSLATRGKAEALQAAQKSLLQSSSFGHPYYWAPFSLIGDWQ